MSWAAECRKALWLIAALASVHSNSGAQDLHILVLGDSVSQSCPPQPPRSTPHICKLDAVWQQVQALHASARPSIIRFTPLIADSSSMADWQRSEPLGAALHSLMDQAAAAGIRYDYAIWQHGARTQDVHRQVYFGHLFSLMRQVSSQVPVRRWLIATHSSCGSSTHPPVAKAQSQAGDFRLAHRYPGANLDTLPPGSWQRSGCGLTPAGEAALAQRWVQVIARSDEEASQLEAESLLTLFRGLTGPADF